MQTTDTENQEHKMKHKDSSISFCPSPNIKHDKKKIQPNLEEENSLISGNQASGSQGSFTDGQESEVTSTVLVQPSLPSWPPLPPDTPPVNTNVKNDIMDENPEMNNVEDLTKNQSEGCSTRVLYSTNQLTTELETDNSKEVIMCRNFVRGTCTKGDKCIFVHRVILSQLPSVYQFCKSFQNTVCNFRKCKFVHATVSEKEYFFLTGYLPPHTLSHLKEMNMPQPPPPPPPAEEFQTQVPPIFKNFLSPPPPPPPPQIFSMGVLSSTANLPAQQRTFNRRDDRARARARLAPIHRRSLSQIF